MDPKRLMKWEKVGTCILGFISIRPGLMAPPGVSVSVLQIPQESLAGKFQAKFKEKSLASPSTWLTNQRHVTHCISPGQNGFNLIKMLSACVLMRD